MRRKLALCAAAVSIAILTTHGPVDAIPLEQPVLCGDEECGTMRITRYRTSEFADASGHKFVGVVIDGKFEEKKNRIFHYIQAVVKDDLPPLFTDRTLIEAPYVDAPPGGYLGRTDYTIDLLPYYDQTSPEFIRFPTFFDQPGVPVDFGSAPGETLTVRFETWLVCVIDEKFGDDLGHAKDDKFTVAPLLGWSWGFSTKRISSEPDFGGWETTALELAPLTKPPSKDWQTAIAKEYGKDPNNDRFNVTLGDCKDCIPESHPTPQPLPLILLVAGVIALVMKRARAAGHKRRHENA